ncbi:hypothetical protein IC229_04475 [Spirosoma sp. BT702]|uniref:Lipoprotein n=1 Tax=Spirosoma profusum TaxID=2771354 RepID=A0A926XTB6_9BACT|nr:DUF6252 family protein [Spirosoma profusum]MBD2699878.1 hypothetical protein [Spirosoma profusum]
MKTLRFAAILAFSGIISLTSCSKKNDDSVTPTGTGTQQQSSVAFATKVDGKEFKPDFAYAKISFPGNDGYYGIYGLDSKTSDVAVIALPNSAQVGTHELSSISFGSFTKASTSDAYSTVVKPGTGTVTITKKTATEIAGTFSFTAYNEKGIKITLTDGTFNVPIK